MNTEENKRVSAEFLERFADADTDGALALLDDAVVWRAMGREGSLPISGEMNKEGIGTLINNVKAAFPGKLQLTPTGWTAQGDRVAIELESYGTKENGTVYNNYYHFLFVVSNGKIRSIREYFDTIHVKQVFLDDI